MLEMLTKLFELPAFDGASTINGMTVVPLIGNGVKLDYLLLSEAQQTGNFSITEVSEDGTVSWLLAKNETDKKVLLIEGEELLGGKQNRTVNVTILLAELTTTKIPVSCVEKRRWSVKSEHFIDSCRVVDFNVKSYKLKEYADKREARLTFHPAQDVIWEAVDELMDDYCVWSETSAAYDVFLTIKKDDISKYVGELKPLDGQVGIAVFMNGELVGIEYLAPHEKFKMYFKKLFSTYLLTPEWLKKEVKKSSKKRMNIKESLGDPEEFTLVKSVGLGRNIYAKWENYAAHGLEYEGNIVQLSLLRIPS